MADQKPRLRPGAAATAKSKGSVTLSADDFAAMQEEIAETIDAMNECAEFTKTDGASITVNPDHVVAVYQQMSGNDIYTTIATGFFSFPVRDRYADVLAALHMLPPGAIVGAVGEKPMPQKFAEDETAADTVDE